METLRELAAVLEEADAPGNRLKVQRELLAEVQRELRLRAATCSLVSLPPVHLFRSELAAWRLPLDP